MSNSDHSVTYPKIVPSQLTGCTRQLISVERQGEDIHIANVTPFEASDRNLAQQILDWGASDNNRIFLAERESSSEWRSETYADAARNIAALAHHFRRHFVADRAIAVSAPNSIALARVVFAAQLSGAPIAILNPRWVDSSGGIRKIASAVRAVNAQAVLVPDQSVKERVYQTNESLGEICEAIDRLPMKHDDAAAGSEWRTPSDTAGATAIYLFTSGSTGDPKCVPLTHRMLLTVQASAGATLYPATSAPDTLVDWLPWHHVMGGVVNLGRVIRTGGSLYIDEGKPVEGAFDATLDNLRSISPSAYTSVPVALDKLASALADDRSLALSFFRNLPFIRFGGAPLPGRVRELLEEVALATAGRPVPVVSGYGATEMAGLGFSAFRASKIRGFIGLPYPGVTAKLISIGGNLYNLRISGDNVFTGYLDGAKPFDSQGFYETGDQVTLADPDDPLKGVLFAGRSADTFKLSSGTWFKVEAARAGIAKVLGDCGGHVVFHGDGQKSAVALAWVGQRSQSIDVIGQALAKFNKAAAPSGRIAALGVSFRSPPGLSELLTEKGSLNTRLARQRFAPVLEQLHTLTEGSVVDISSQFESVSPSPKQESHGRTL